MIATETHSPNARLYLARCFVELKRLPEAYDMMKSVATDPNADPKYAKTKDTAAQELAPLESRVGHLQVTIAPELKNATVTVNGKAVSSDKLSSVTVDVGNVVVDVASAGAAPQEQQVSVGGGESKSLAFSAVPTVVAPPPSKGIGVIRAAGIGVGGLGIVSLAIGIGTGVAANGKFSSVQSACNNTRCTDPKYASDIDAGKSLEKAADATFVIGGLLVAASIPMIIFGGPKHARTDAASASLIVSPTLGGAFVGAAGTF